MEAECIKIDGICKTVDEVNRKASLDVEWNEKSLQLEEIKENMKTNSHKIIEFKNNLSGFNAILVGADKENEAIAEATNPKGKRRKGRFEGYPIHSCVALWVTCDSCNKDFHTFCQGYSVSEEEMVTQEDKYFCHQCSSKIKNAEELVSFVIKKSSGIFRC